jgi:hypothetical protein
MPDVPMQVKYRHISLDIAESAGLENKTLTKTPIFGMKMAHLLAVHLLTPGECVFYDLSSI